ncbi:MAG: CoA transferase, partial [Actinobacteria bacterium]|nr:CoA transferase [Actinomycetota bacterium]
FAGNERRVARRDEVEAQLAAAVAALPASELLRRLEQGQVAYASVKQVTDVLAHPQLADRWREVAAGERQVPALLPPVRHAGFGAPLRPVPRLGEHTAAVLAELRAAGDSGPDRRPG